MKFSAAVKLLADRFSKFFTLPTGANGEKKQLAKKKNSQAQLT